MEGAVVELSRSDILSDFALDERRIERAAYDDATAEGSFSIPIRSGKIFLVRVDLLKSDADTRERREAWRALSRALIAR